MKVITPAGTDVKRMGDEFTKLVTLILQQDKFRDQLRLNPAAALREQGFKSTDEIIRELKKFNWRAAEQVALAFGWKPRESLPPRFFT